MTAAIVVAEDLGAGFWLDEAGIMCAGTLLPDGSGLGPLQRTASFPDERLVEILALLRAEGAVA